MSWYTLHEATKRGPSERAWMQRVLAGEVSSYVDGRGQRRVWVEEAEEPTPWHLESAVLPLGREVSSLRRELKDLRVSVKTPAARETTPPRNLEPVLLAPTPTPTPLSEAPTIRFPRAVVPLAVELIPPAPEMGPNDGILDLVAKRWRGSDRKLEREAGLPKAFLAKARKGLRNGPKSAKSWERLESFMRAGERVREAA